MECQGRPLIAHPLHILTNIHFSAFHRSTMGIPFYNPKPSPPAAYGGQLIPWPTLNPFAKLTMSWMTDIFKIAHGRQLEADGECNPVIH